MLEPPVETNSETAGGPRTANDETTPDNGRDPDVQMSDPVERDSAGKTSPDPDVVVGNCTGRCARGGRRSSCRNAGLALLLTTKYLYLEI